MRLHIILIQLFCSITFAHGYRILVAVFTPAYSHQTSLRPLWKGLAEKGHDVVLLTTNPETEDPAFRKIRQIDLGGSYEVLERHGASEIISQGNYAGRGILDRVLSYWDALDAAADWQLDHPEVKALIQNKSEHFDLVITEIMNPIHLGFVERFKVPFIGVASLDAPYRIHERLGNYMHPSIFPDYFLPFAPPLSFPKRLLSVTFNWIQDGFMYFRQYPRQTAIARKHFGAHIRELKEVEKDMSFLFLNINPAFAKIRPLSRNTILLGGGTHLKKTTKPLPDGLRQFVDSAKEGFIYISFGSNVKSAFIGEKLQKLLMDVSSKLPYKVLWKLETDKLVGIPKNMRVEKWLPQQDIFAHPNLKLFITQGGPQSIEEALLHTLPMIGITFMGDQHVSGQIIQQKGLGISFHRDAVTEESLEKAILEIMNNSSYVETVKKEWKIVSDLEVPPVQRAIFWTEYCIRHKGARHLRNPVIDVPLYQFYYLDIIGFFVALLFVLISIPVLILKFSRSLLKKMKSKTE